MYVHTHIHSCSQDQSWLCLWCMFSIKLTFYIYCIIWKKQSSYSTCTGLTCTYVHDCVKFIPASIYIAWRHDWHMNGGVIFNQLNRFFWLQYLSLRNPQNHCILTCCTLLFSCLYSIIIILPITQLPITTWFRTCHMCINLPCSFVWGCSAKQNDHSIAYVTCLPHWYWLAILSSIAIYVALCTASVWQTVSLLWTG